MRALRIPEYLRIENCAVRRALYALFATIVVDGLITEFLVTNGYGSEVNPLLRSLVGQQPFLPIKILGAFLVTLFLWIKYNTAPKRVHTVITVALAFYTAIIYWNLFVYFLAVSNYLV